MIKNITLLVLSAITLLSCSGPAGPEEVMEGYLDAHNSNDVAAVMEWFHDDAVLQLPGQPPISDIQKAEAWDAAISSRLEYVDWQVDGKTVIIGRIIERNNWLKKAGIQQMEYEPGSRMVTRDGRIEKLVMAPVTEESRRALDQVYRSFFAWLHENYPEKLEELTPGGEIAVNEEVATQWFALLDEWLRNK